MLNKFKVILALNRKLFQYHLFVIILFLIIYIVKNLNNNIF